MMDHKKVVIQRSSHSGNIFLVRSFWVRVVGHMKRDIAQAFQSLYIGINVMLAVLLGITLFLLEFPLVKDFVLYVVVIPLSLFLIVKYLTLFPIIFFFIFLFLKIEHSLIVLSFMVPLSLIWVLLV